MDGEKVSSLTVGRGLFVLRYESADVVETAPRVFVRPSPGCEQSIAIISEPSEVTGCMSAPGAALVVCCREPSSLQITVRGRSGALGAKIRLEPVARKKNVAARRPAPTSVRGDGPKVVGHLARRGDVEVSFGDWLAGPSAPAPIEGFTFTDISPALGLQMQVLVRGDRDWSAWRSAEEFVGSRGQAKPLIGLRLRIGKGAATSIEGEALFLGSAIQRKSGTELEFRSNMGADPLVGLRLSLRAAGAVMPAQAPRSAAKSAPGGLRVFRSSEAHKHQVAS